ncbi:acetoacetate-CoA ligase like protein [Zymoseptoria brevis]|uniref:Acetoacetate-CoA ligase like protein n=1 Tax=Zymoseptoria brevis TaxID=1047168 RepID=A0A0F4GR15_9PEZI|nr:acetoacetate-CoA ligase like protein [Zymoseptoria brevis]
MSKQSSSPQPLWTPRLPGNAPMDIYRQHVNKRYSQNLKTSRHLQRWSAHSPHEFWIDLYSYLGLIPELPTGIQKAYDDTLPMSSNPPFFPHVLMNYAENAMFSNPDPSAIALIGLGEDTHLDNRDGEILTWSQFREKVRLTASALLQCGVKKGDRVGALVATSIWAMVLFHASASIGAIFTCISPDLGLEGCVSRLQQVTPGILFADSHTIYKGKAVSTLDKVKSILNRLSPQPQLYIVPLAEETASFPLIDDFIHKANPSYRLEFVRVPFNHPLMICYSSGTTGAPKCVVHQHGMIIQLKKIAVIHNSTTHKDVILQYSSTSWVVFYIMCGYFACGATTLVYNGSPMYPSTTQLLRLVEKYRVTYFGTSPRYLLEVQMANVVPKERFDLSSLRIVYTTGATLSSEQYRWFYKTFPEHVHLCNTAGGTDTATSLIAADPTRPIYAGEMQIYALGMDVDIADPITGASIADSGEAGEMIVRRPFPSMPCFFWGDTDGSKYRSSYFERFDTIDVWAQHDWLQKMPGTGGLVMHGRSDGVLNPSGIRFGSGEIYAIVESPPFTSSIYNTLCVGRRRPQDADEDVFLFLVMSPDAAFTPQLSSNIKTTIRRELSPRHVPRFVIPVPAIPVTINGKKVEAAVKQTLGGKDVVASNTVLNPESIAYFRRFRDLEREPNESKM